MLYGRVRARTTALCAALAFVLVGCGAQGPGSGSPRSSTGDLFSALPGTVSSIPAPPSASPEDKARAAVPSDPGPQWKRVTTEDFDTFRSDAYGTYDSVGAFGSGLRRSSAISVADGVLNITARGDVSGGMAHNLDQTYGRWEFRARTDKGRGFGSAILLWPESERFPQDGEIDITEVPSETRDRSHMIVHFPGPGGSDKVYGSYAEDDFSQWHTFAVDWLRDRIVFYIDGVERFRVTDRNIIPDKPMHLAMQFDQGPKKDWIPAPDATTPAAFALQVDWLRVYAPSDRS